MPRWNKADIERMWNERVTADFKRDSKLMLQQSGEAFLSFSVGMKVSQYQYMKRLYPVVLHYLKRKHNYILLTKDPYFDVSRKKPKKEDVFKQVVCFSLQAKPGPAREKAQRLGGIMELLHARGVKPGAVEEAIRGMGGMAKAHEAAKRFRREKAGRQQPQLLNIQSSSDPAGLNNGSDIDGTVEVHQPNGKGVKPPTGAKGGKRQRNFDYLQVTATDEQKETVLEARRVKLTLLIEGDPDAVDGWKLVIVEEVEVIE